MTAARLLRRLRAMDREEVRDRSLSTVRRAIDRAAFTVRRPIWQRSAFESIASGDGLVASAAAHARRRDWRSAHDALLRHVAEGACRFVLDPRRRDDTSRLLRRAFPDAPAQARERAEGVVAGRFDLLGYAGLSFTCGDRPIDWHYDPVHGRHCPRGFWDRVPYLSADSGDHKIIWELNRHQYLMTLGRAYWLTGDRRFRSTFIDHLYSWLEDNPPLDGINWASMLELGLRSISWIWALHFFADSPSVEDEQPWAIDLFVALDTQLRLVERNLSRYFSPNTHLLGEALALYVAGRTLPMRHAPRWADLGRSVLAAEIARQINEDGGHAELSTHYHRYTLDIYLMALAIAIRTEDSVAPTFSRAVDRLAAFAQAVADDLGRLPNLGDEDGGALFRFCGRVPSDVSDSLQIAADLLGQPELRVGSPAEESLWITGRLPSTSTPAERPRSVWLRASGYYVSRPGAGDLLIIDGGRHGFLNGGHAHADALSIVATVDSRPLLIDPGTGCYTVDPALRDRFRSSELHNTLTLDGRSQSVPDGPFHWRSTARASARAWTAERGFDYFEGEHDGYAPAMHRRTLLSRRDCWTVVDRVISSNRHHVAVHWHVHPDWDVSHDAPHLIRAKHRDGFVVWLAVVGPRLSIELVRGAAEPSGLGWCSPVYGALAPSTTIRVTSDEVQPFVLATALVPSAERPAIERVAVTGHREAIGLRVATRDWVDTMVFASLDRGSPAAPPWSAGSLQSDATVVCWRETSGEHGQALALIGGTFVNHTSRTTPPAPRSAGGRRGRVHAVIGE